MKRRAIPYSVAEMAWLEANRMLVISDYHRAFVEAFERTDVTKAHLHALRKRKGWKVGRAAGRTKGRRLRYSPAEIEWLRENCTLSIADYCRQFHAAFGRDDITEAKLHSLRKREGWRTGRTGRFETGQEPWSKGRKIGNNPGSAKTQFGKGEKAHNYRGAGHERVCKSTGYVILTLDERNPWTGAATRPVHKHRYIWEQANGPVPDGMVLKSIDGDRTNTDLSNWELVPRGLLPRLNGKSGRNYDQAPAEIRPTIMAVAKLEHAVESRRKAVGR